MDIQHLAIRVGKELQRHAPTILTAIGAAGVAATAYLAAKATWKSAVDMEAAWPNNWQHVHARDKVELVWKNYIPAASMALATMSCVVAANTISVKRQSALLGAYALGERALQSYRDKMVEQVGPEKALEVQKEIVKEQAAETSAKNIGEIASGQTIFLDSLSGQYFLSDVETIRKAMNETNQKCINDNYASMNYFYSLIGARRTQLGEVIGWNTWRMLDVILTPGLTTEDGQECIGMDYVHQPMMEYYAVE